MALTVDEIAEMLNTMRVENEHNVENFEKVLTGINAKLEIMSEDSEATDLIKLYISELKKAVEDRHKTAIERFEFIDNSIQNILSFQDSVAKTEELKDFFHVLSLNFDNFSGEISDQKNILEKIDEKLSVVNSNTFNKDELAGFINGLSADLSDLDNKLNKSFSSFENILSDFSSNVKELSTFEQVEDLKNKIDLISFDVNSLPEKISIENLEEKISYFQNLIDTTKDLIKETQSTNAELLEETFKNFENSLKNIVTDSDFAGFKSDLADFVQKIIDNSSALNNNLSYSTDRIENILATVNALNYDTDLKNIVEILAELKSIISSNSQVTVNSLKSEIVESSEKILNQISDLEKVLSEVKSNDELIEFRQSLTDLITKIQNDTNSLNSDLSYSVKRIENIYDAVNSMTFKDNLDDIELKIDELKDLVNLVSSDNSSEFENLQKTFSSIVTDSDFAGFKSDLANFVQKIIDNSSALNKELEHTTERIENILTLINSIDFREDFENIVSKINELKETFEEGAKVNYTNLSLEISDLSDKLDLSFSDLDEKRQEIYGNLKNELDRILENISNLIELNPQKSIENLSVLVEQITENIQLIRNGISSDIQDDYGDIKASVNSIIVNLQNSKDEIITNNFSRLDSFDNNFEKINNKLDEQINNFSGLKDLLIENNKSDSINIIDAIDKLNADISEIISASNENDNSNYEAVKDYIEELTVSLNNLQIEFNNISEKNSSNILSGITNVSDNISLLKEEFRQAAESNIKNSSKIADGLSLLTERINEIPDIISSNSTKNLEAIKLSFEELMQNLSGDFEKQKEVFSQINELSDQKKLEVLNNLSSDIKNVQNWLDSNNEIFKSVVKNNILEIKEFIGEANNSIYESQVVSEKKLTSKLEALELLYQTFESSVSDVNSGIKNILENINHLDATEQNETVKQEINNLKNTIEVLSENLNKIEDKNNEFVSILLNLSEVVLKKDDINNLENKLNEFTDLIYSVRDIVKNSKDENSIEISKLCEKFDGSISKILSEDVFETYKKDLIALIQKIIDNSEIIHTYSVSNQTKLSEVLEKISKFEPVNYSYDLEQITLKLDNLREIFETNSEENFNKLSEQISEVKNEISKNNVSELVDNKFGKIAEILNSVKEIISNSAELNSNVINDKFELINEHFSNIVTEEDFMNFRADFSDFIQKILDNVTVAHLNSDTNKEKLFEVAEQIKALDNSEDFENILTRIDGIKNDIFVNSKMNYDNIINAVNLFKDEFNKNISESCDDRNEKYNNINKELSEILLNVQILKDFSSEKSAEIFENISTDLHSSFDELKENIKSCSQSDIENLKKLIDDTNLKIVDFSNDFVQKYDSNLFNISSGFDNIKISIENLINAFTNFRGLLKDDIYKNLENLLPDLNDIISKIDNLLDEFHNISVNYSEKILNSVNEISVKFDNLSLGITGEFHENMAAFRDILNSLSDNFESIHSEISQQIKDNNDIQLVELKSISANVNDFKSHVSEAAENLKDYISELNLAAKSSKSLSDSKFSEKLLDLEASFVHSSEIYEQKMELLQGKLSEFAQIIEGSSSDTEAKIASSVEEIADVKTELSLLSDFLKNLKLSSDEKYTETIASIETGISNIINDLDNVRNSISESIDDKLKENIIVLDEKFDNLINLIKDLTSNNLADSLEEKLSGLKQEINLVNTDITNALQEKYEKIENSFDIIKSGIDELSKYDFDNIISDIKSELEKSFMNLSVDINGEFASSTEAINKLEQAYKETFNSISEIEVCVSDTIQNSIELLNVAVENNSKGIRNIIVEKLDILKDELFSIKTNQLNVSEVIKNVDELSANLNQKLDVLVENSDTEEILNVLNEIELKAQERGVNLKDIIDSIHSKIDLIANDTSLKLELSSLNDKINSIADDKLVETALKMLSDKIDVLVMDSSVSELQKDLSKSFSEINSKIDVIVSDNSLKDVSEKLTENFELINSKIDVIASDSSFEDLQEKFDEISETEEKVAEMLSALHEKVDVLAMDGSDFDLEEEIDDIKDLIFEQRKYFEATSDEKAAAIDKYLRDVLLKLDNVDLEKNSEDIKESIMNALVSLFDQISFVEETEDIKDFVEEKTDEINQNLIEVQNQLKQIASSNDDFDYSYTLQDVETDIAKLRLAINNMSGSDFESLSDNIKKIVKSVEGLESSLTQDQVVDLKSDIEKLNEDILSISSRTNKILLSSDESYKALNEGLNNFSSLVYKLEDRINYLDNNAVSERLEKKIDNIQSMSIASANADKVFHQVMMYLGEWIDSTTENISSITEKTSEIADIKESINELKEAVPEKSSILDELEEKFEQQELRIDRLEMKIEKILSALEQKDDMMLNRKVDKIEKLISRLGTNIEKLASYVDEE